MSQVQLLNQMEAMYSAKKIDLRTFRNAITRCRIMFEDNRTDAQDGVEAKLVELHTIAFG